MRYGQPIDRCPCCGGPAPGGDLHWFRRARCLVGNDRALIMGPIQAALFDALWRARLSMEGLDRATLAARMWVGSPKGGPEDDKAVGVYVSGLRKKIRPFGITIVSTGGPGSTTRLVSVEGRRHGYAHVIVGALRAQ